MIRILVADDHAIVRKGIVQLLSTQGDLLVAAEASSAQETLQMAEAMPAGGVDLFMLDLTMPGASGVPLIERLRREHPATPILVLSMHIEGPIVARALRAGATGYVAKDSDITVLLTAVRHVAGGGRFIDPTLVEGVVFEPTAPGALHEALSERESQVLGLIVAGVRLGEIADRLRVSAKTVSTHKMRLMHKLGVSSNAELVRYAISHQLTAGPDATE